MSYFVDVSSEEDVLFDEPLVERVEGGEQDVSNGANYDAEVDPRVVVPVIKGVRRKGHHNEADNELEVYW